MSDIAADKELAIYREAADMAQTGKSIQEIKTAIVEMGVTENEAATIAQQVTYYRTRQREKTGNSQLIWGIILLLGGIVATSATDGHMVFYGAIVVGIIKIIAGIASNSSS